MKFFEFISSFFESKWRPYTYKETVIEKEEIYANRYDDLMTNDPCDIGSVPTGKFREVKYEIWVSYNKKTGLPRYKRIKV